MKKKLRHLSNKFQTHFVCVCFLYFLEERELLPDSPFAAKWRYIRGENTILGFNLQPNKSITERHGEEYCRHEGDSYQGSRFSLCTKYQNNMKFLYPLFLHSYQIAVRLATVDSVLVLCLLMPIRGKCEPDRIPGIFPLSRICNLS